MGKPIFFSSFAHINILINRKSYKNKWMRNWISYFISNFFLLLINRFITFWYWILRSIKDISLLYLIEKYSFRSSHHSCYGLWTIFFETFFQWKWRIILEFNLLSVNTRCINKKKLWMWRDSAWKKNRNQLETWKRLWFLFCLQFIWVTIFGFDFIRKLKTKKKRSHETGISIGTIW